MPKIQLRNFRKNDLGVVSRLAELAFSDPNLQEGGTPDAVIHHLRSLRRPHIRILTSLLRYRLEMIVAEVDGNLAGFVMMNGRNQVNMNTLMIDPDYRRCGIGFALVEETFRRAHNYGYRFATAEVLVNNLPSARLCQKLGFEVYDTYTPYETSLPLDQPAERSPRNWVSLRPVQANEQAAFKEIERKLVSPLDLQIRGSASRFFFPSLYRKLVDFREHKQFQAWAVEKDGQPVGFQYVYSSLGNPKGTLARPLLPDSRLNFLPSVVELAGDWFAELGKNSLRLDVSAERPHLLEKLSCWNWHASVGWLCLVKWLDAPQKKES
jgi:ribosomal protein S18 acetylase RimI-like enzyme